MTAPRAGGERNRRGHSCFQNSISVFRKESKDLFRDDGAEDLSEA